MLVPRTVRIRQRGSAQATNLPSLAEANILLNQQATQAPIIDSNTQNLIRSPQPTEKTASCVSRTQISHRENDEPTGAHLKSHSRAITTCALEQRPALDEGCVICGRYGGCICDTPSHAAYSMETIEIDSAATENLLYGPSNVTTSAGASSAVSQGTSGSHISFYHNSRMIASITGYRDSPQTVALSTQAVKNLRTAHQIHIQGKQIPKPIQSFEDCGLPARMLSNLAENGYLKPRGVQMQVVPAGLYGRDMIISATTGAGKTAGYLIPILTHAYGLSQLPGDAMEGPFALILTPTRELAMQIEEVVKVMVRGMSNMRTALLVGGQAMANQVHRLRQNIQIAVATPGRMVDILARHEEISFSNVFCLVLDEVDMMVSMGFRKQVKRILDVLPVPPNGRQTIVCSATIPRQVEQLASKLMHDGLRIRIGDVDVKAGSDEKKSTPKLSDVFSPSSQIKQTIIWVENDSKKKQLLSLLRDPAYFRPPVLVFVESRLGSDLLAHVIQVKCPGITAVSMHGEKEQERSAILKSFIDGTAQVIVATGLLARGLDLKAATVINFDMASSIEEYVHRVGRANSEAATKAAEGIRRGPKLGSMAWAITFINNDHRSILSEFANMLHKLGSERVTPLPAQLKQLIVPDSSKSESFAQLSNCKDKNPPTMVSSGSQASKRKASGSLRQHNTQTKSPKLSVKRRRKAGIIDL